MRGFMEKLIVTAIVRAFRHMFCVTVLFAGYLSYFFVAVALQPDRLVGLVPSTDPKNPLVTAASLRTDWLSSVSFAFEELWGRPFEWSIEAVWRAGIVAAALFAGSVCTRWLLARLVWSHVAARSLRSVPLPVDPWMLATIFGIGFVSCGLLHEFRMALMSVEVDALPPLGAAIPVGLLLGAGHSTLTVLLRRRYPLGSGLVCEKCGYDMSGLTLGVCPECAAPTVQHATIKPAPEGELKAVRLTAALVASFAMAILVFRPGKAAYHQGVIDSLPNAGGSFPYTQAVRITTKDGSWVLRCTGTPVADLNGMQALLEATCTLTREGTTGPEAVTTASGPLEPSGQPLRFGNGQLRVDVYRWVTFPMCKDKSIPAHLTVIVLGKAVLEAAK